MKNIVETTTELIMAKGKVSSEDIIAAIYNEQLNSLDKKELSALIYNDLLTNGNFIVIDGQWDMKNNYTMKDITREQYKTIGNIAIVEEDIIIEEEELELKVDLGDEDESIDPNEAIADIDGFVSLNEA